MNRIALVAVALALSLSACAGRRYAQVSPGMTGAQVTQIMTEGPTKVVPYEDQYASWYYSEDYCFLLKDDKVVAKSESENRGSAYAAGVAVRAKELAQCLPPGVQAPTSTQVQVNTPVGTFTTQQ